MHAAWVWCSWLATSHITIQLVNVLSLTGIFHNSAGSSVTSSYINLSCSEYSHMWFQHLFTLTTLPLRLGDGLGPRGKLCSRLYNPVTVIEIMMWESAYIWEKAIVRQWRSMYFSPFDYLCDWHDFFLYFFKSLWCVTDLGTIHHFVT